MQIYDKYQSILHQPFLRFVLEIRSRIILKRVLYYSMNVLIRCIEVYTGKTQELYKNDKMYKSDKNEIISNYYCLLMFSRCKNFKCSYASCNRAW